MVYSYISKSKLGMLKVACVDTEPSLFDEIDPEAEAAADAEGLADLDAGRTISHAAMNRWLLPWGTPDELPPPRVGH